MKNLEILRLDKTASERAANSQHAFELARFATELRAAETMALEPAI